MMSRWSGTQKLAREESDSDNERVSLIPSEQRSYVDTGTQTRPSNIVRKTLVVSIPCILALPTMIVVGSGFYHCLCSSEGFEECYITTSSIFMGVAASFLKPGEQLLRLSHSWLFGEILLLGMLFFLRQPIRLENLGMERKVENCLEDMERPMKEVTEYRINVPDDRGEVKWSYIIRSAPQNLGQIKMELMNNTSFKKIMSDWEWQTFDFELVLGGRQGMEENFSTERVNLWLREIRGGDHKLDGKQQEVITPPVNETLISPFVNETVPAGEARVDRPVENPKGSVSLYPIIGKQWSVEDEEAAVRQGHLQRKIDAVHDKVVALRTSIKESQTHAEHEQLSLHAVEKLRGWELKLTEASWDCRQSLLAIDSEIARVKERINALLITHPPYDQLLQEAFKNCASLERQREEAIDELSATVSLILELYLSSTKGAPDSVMEPLGRNQPLQESHSPQQEWHSSASSLEGSQVRRRRTKGSPYIGSISGNDSALNLLVNSNCLEYDNRRELQEGTNISFSEQENGSVLTPCSDLLFEINLS